MPTSIKPSILIVEDEEDVLQLLRDLLQSHGFAITSAGDPQTAYEYSENVQPDLFMIDLRLPQMTGVELAKCLRAAGHRETPMIAMSVSRHMLREAVDSGLFDATVAKPFDVRSVLQLVEHSVDYSMSGSQQSGGAGR
jgi:CheY-like chemotaxis protein